jgi:hypothetical protein
MCFNEGTKILCFRPIPDYDEVYVPIQDLREGDLVKTLRHGYRHVAMIGKGTMYNDPQNIWESMYQCNDLIITGGHGILCDKLTAAEYANLTNIYHGSIAKIEDKFLVFANQSQLFSQINHSGKFTYYHLALESDGDDYRRFGIWANGVLTETTTIHHFIQNNLVPL